MTSNTPRTNPGDRLAKIRQVFRFLKDFNALRNPMKRQVKDHPWAMWLNDLPKHPCVWLRGSPTELSEADEAGEVVLRVRRPELQPPPAFPKTLDGWLPSNWNDRSLLSVRPLPERELRTVGRPSRIERFDTDKERVSAYRTWSSRRDRWAAEARLAYRALELFNQLYEVRGHLERKGESLQLALGQGILVWRREDGDVRHPIISQRLRLSFDPSIPEFTVAEEEQPPELIRPLLSVNQPGAARIIKDIDDALAEHLYDLLNVEHIAGLLRQIAAALHAQGQFVDSIRDSSPEDYPQIGCDPVLYLQERTAGFAAAIDYILEDLVRPNRDLPAGLLRICGIEERHLNEIPEILRTPWEEPADIFFTKDANKEQIQIADRVARHGNVLVQGPPGTGKTHTIANLIGHLLSQGKRVLVTAHTSKALRVVRDKVSEPLQALCVSLLDSETESRKELEAAVDTMVARICRDDPIQLDREGDAAEKERNRLVTELTRLRRQLIAAREDEYREVILAGERIPPSKAAKFVAATATENNWIPGRIEPGAPLPLSDAEVEELYASNCEFSPEQEVELTRWRPAPGEVPGAEDFAGDAVRYRQLELSDRATGENFWTGMPGDGTEEELRLIERRIQASIQLLADAPAWKLDAVTAGMASGPDAKAPWEELIARIHSLLQEARRSSGLLLDYRCSLGGDFSAEECKSLAREMRVILESGTKGSPIWVRIRPRWRKFLSTARVNDEKPRTAREFEALEVYAGLIATRKALGARWTNQITLRGGPKWEEFGPNPEAGVALFATDIRSLLGWHAKQFEPLVQSLRAAGFDWDAFVTAQPVLPGDHPELRRLINAIVSSLPPILSARISTLQLRALERKFRKWNSALFSTDANVLPASAVLDLRRAISAKDNREYEAAFGRLAELHELAPAFARRQELLLRLRSAAPDWAQAIHLRIPPHDSPKPPGSATSAWKWLQCRLELDRRTAVSISDLEDRIAETRRSIREITARLIELRAWAAQCRHVGLAERQALQGWKDTIRRIGRGTGRRAEALRIDARRLLSKARNAVPVWIMPLARLVETFDPRETHFDVVIVDEASQCDIMGLIALYMAEEAIVVGDHEQVSPLAIGQEISEVERLIHQHLPDIPNNHLYDGKLSLYDIARQSFGDMIRLVEHFRCVPEIISFSNYLSYNGTIKPLRDPTSTHIRPSVVAYRLDGIRQGKVNSEEARVIAALLQAAIEQPEYSGMTFGAVSLLGEEQAVEIERWVRRTSSPQDLTTRQFLCGIAAHFQGDERNVVFLSLVDSPAESPLPLRDADMYRQRFNVAASRARDQLWIVHSLDPKRDLKNGDLRRRLIEHAENPRALLEMQLTGEDRTESEFERLVLKRLVADGYRVTPQWVVGHYRIDLVVEGGGRRLAIECDGDRFHPIEKIADDMARQASLERLGWRFVRIRGSEFFRDPDAAIRKVFNSLAEVGIYPERCTSDPPTPTNDLLDRIKRRAAEILRELRT